MYHHQRHRSLQQRGNVHFPPSMTLKISIDNALFPLSYFFGFLSLSLQLLLQSFLLSRNYHNRRSQQRCRPATRPAAAPAQTDSVKCPSTRSLSVCPFLFFMVSVPSFPALRRIRRSNKSTIKKSLSDSRRPGVSLATAKLRLAFET